MINENNNALEIEIFLILLSRPLLTFFNTSLSPLALTIHVHFDLWVIAGHHLF